MIRGTPAAPGERAGHHGVVRTEPEQPSTDGTPADGPDAARRPSIYTAPDRPRGLFARQPPVEAPDVGIPLPAGGTTHLAGLTRRSRLTEVEIFAFDQGDRSPIAALLVSIELPRGHPGEHGQWCA